MSSLPIYELMALVASILWGMNAVLIRLGLATSNATSAVVFSLSANALVHAVLVSLFVPVRQYLIPAVLLFILGGLIQPGIVRSITYWSYGRIGVARTSPIRASTPVVTVFLAIVFLGERPSVTTLLGAVAIVGGIVFLSLEPPEPGATWRKRHLLIPVAAAILAGISQNIRKTGLNYIPVPMLAAFLTATTSWATTFGAAVGMRGFGSFRYDRRNLFYFGCAAVVSSIGQLLSFYAVWGSRLSSIAPLANTTPLFAILFTAIFLREMERVTLRVVLGGLIVVGGVMLILL